MVRIDIIDGSASMDVAQLTAFLRVVREGSFTRAARTLGIGQPAVSARIGALEAEVGGALFTRGRRVALTPLGEGFLPFARRATEVLAEGLEAARLSRTGQRGRVTLASLGSVAAGLVGPALATVAAAHPSLEWLVRSADHEGVLAMLFDGLVELGVVVWPCLDTGAADLTRLFLMREPIVLAVAPDHPLARRRRVDRDDVARLGRPFLRLRWWRTHHPEVTRLADRAATSMDVPMETARFLVMRGAAVGFFPTTYIADDLAERTLVAVPVHDLAPLTRAVALVRGRRPAPPAPATAAVIAALREQARALGILRG
ncbi:LysR family transcriptional regulator [Sorangium sp. So ce1078]|uniref:LysR family transcriptional regulator n=1 Tax=Sorangium sp. So ce1078 TaxID=3133329 RepID=UPI003F5E0E8A